ncbi:MAG: sigma-70 family RNA polymerase sigma factor, partial [Myxococcales bacterium]|nr:sigma-70 family RNA polymerase sigma factor [Myxococcales bacterium]
FRGEGSLEGWLVRMVINACRRMQRGRKNDPALHQEDAVLPDESQSPERATESSEIGVHLRQALSELPNTDRMILLLSEGDGWSAIEIAERLGMTHGAVRTRLTRIRQALQKKLAPLGLLPDS